MIPKSRYEVMQVDAERWGLYDNATQRWIAFGPEKSIRGALLNASSAHRVAIASKTVSN